MLRVRSSPFHAKNSAPISFLLPTPFPCPQPHPMRPDPEVTHTRADRRRVGHARVAHPGSGHAHEPLPDASTGVVRPPPAGPREHTTRGAGVACGAGPFERWDDLERARTGSPAALTRTRRGDYLKPSAS